MSRTLARVLLTCKHIAGYDPRPENGETVYCRKCQDYRAVLLDAVEWHLRCLTSHCHYGAYYGEDKGQAMRAAGKHLTRYPSHTVEARHGTDDPLALSHLQLPLISLEEST
jgi:hypothetical protein